MAYLIGVLREKIKPHSYINAKDGKYQSCDVINVMEGNVKNHT